MGRIIVLQGNQDTGKSTTIGLLYDYMINHGYSVVQVRRIYRGMPSHDFLAILQKNKKIIGITTYGDSPWIINKKIHILIQHGCEIIVCACHNEGSTVDAIRKITGYLHEFISKTRSNNNDMRILFDRVEQLI